MLDTTQHERNSHKCEAHIVECVPAIFVSYTLLWQCIRLRALAHSTYVQLIQTDSSLLQVLHHPDCVLIRHHLNQSSDHKEVLAIGLFLL